MNKFIFLFSLILCFVSMHAHAQYQDAGQVLNQVYSAQKTGCTQVSVTTTGHNRSGPWTVGRRYVVYGYNGSDISAGDALKCVWGAVTIDVTGLGGALVGETIFANQQRSFLVKTSNQYISCISKTATMKYDVCPMD